MEKILFLHPKIRPVRNEDIAAISELEEASFKDPFPSYFLSQLAEANPDTFLVTEINEKIVGYAVVDNWTDQQHLVSIAVSAGLRRKGIGQALLHGIMKRLREGPLGLEVRKSNTAAIELYHRNGFTDMGVVHSYYKDGEDAIQMVKPIEKRTEILTPA
jgi:[ribosomal protein S18]-alanine N-acetyltransferase